MIVFPKTSFSEYNDTIKNYEKFFNKNIVKDYRRKIKKIEVFIGILLIAYILICGLVMSSFGPDVPESIIIIIICTIAVLTSIFILGYEQNNLADKCEDECILALKGATNNDLDDAYFDTNTKKIVISDQNYTFNALKELSELKATETEFTNTDYEYDVIKTKDMFRIEIKQFINNYVFKFSKIPMTFTPEEFAKFTKKEGVIDFTYLDDRYSKYSEV